MNDLIRQTVTEIVYIEKPFFGSPKRTVVTIPSAILVRNTPNYSGKYLEVNNIDATLIEPQDYQTIADPLPNAKIALIQITNNPMGGIKTSSTIYSNLLAFKLSDGRCFRFANPSVGGTRTYFKSNKTYTGRDGVKRSVYLKAGKSYVKKRDPKTGKFVYRHVKA